MENIEHSRVENARLGYQTAVNILVWEGQINWTMMNSMTLAHSILIGGIILCLTSPKNLLCFAGCLSFAGLIICLFWFLITKRAFKGQLYWALSARELEEQYLSDPIKILSRGGEFRDGNQVSLRIKRCGQFEEKPIRMWPNIKTQYLSVLVIIVFAIIYISFLASIFRTIIF